jgi:hypothetical protein
LRLQNAARGILRVGAISLISPGYLVDPFRGFNHRIEISPVDAIVRLPLRYGFVITLISFYNFGDGSYRLNRSPPY